jgi:putative transposase
MPQGERVKLVTPGQNQKHYLAGALELKTGRMMHCVGVCKTNALFRVLLDNLEKRYPKARFDKVYMVVDNYGIHKAKAVAQWLAAHPRFAFLFLPTYCPQANPIEERPTDYTWNARQAQPSASHLPSSPFERPNGRGYTALL